MIRCRLVCIAMLWLSACATSPPVAQVQQVAKAFDDLGAASAPLLDDLAIAERTQGRRAALARARHHSAASDGASTSANDRCSEVTQASGAGATLVQNGFCAEDSYYFSDLADPPATAAFRRALAAVGNYTNALVILAEDRNVPAANAQLQSLAGNVGTALAIAGATSLGPALTGLASALQPVLKLAATQANREELARNVTQVAPQVAAVLDQLRASAPELFNTLTEEAMARFRTQGLTSPEIAQMEAARIEAYRAAVSSYVVLLDQYRALFQRLVDSYSAERGSITLSGLVDQSAELSAQADAWRRTFSNLRLGLKQ